MAETSRVVTTCPRCRRSTASPFAEDGVCLRCAGERVFALACGDPESASPLPDPSDPQAVRPVTLPDRIGAYEIIEELGRGGMGCVYAARQIGLGRIVALKVLALNGDLAGVHLRFLREAQTVARLHHPNIVAVHDSGNADGYVYFSMEYVPGGDLGRRLRERPLTPKEAAQLLEKVGGAVSAAHGAGVLHRDIKPSNILLEGDEPKLADFGLAAELEPGGDLTTVSGVLGTPHYLAPEALRGGSSALTVASDIYALGAVLYEMLTGRQPFAGASPAELATLVETAEPPSIRLLAPAVPRDLETICLKCLEREPARRYRDAEALKSDLRHFLDGEPIVARPANAFERLRKLARRHRAPLALVAIAVCALVGGAAASTWLAIRARRAERNAAMEAAASRAVGDFLRDDLLAQAAPSAQPDRNLKLRTVLDRAAERIGSRFQDQPLVEAAVRETLGNTYLSLGAYAEARIHLERALFLRSREQGATAPESLHTASQVANVLFNLTKYSEAQRLAERIFARQKSALGRDHPETLETENILAQIYEWQGNLGLAERWFRDVLTRQQRALGPANEDTLDSMAGLSATMLDAGRFVEAEKLLREMLALSDSLGAENRYRLVAMNNLAGALWSEGRFAEAGELHEQTSELTQRLLGPEHPDTLRSMTNLARTYAAEGRLADAAALHRKVLDIRRRVLGDDYQDTLRSRCYLAATLRDLGRLDEAEPMFAETLEKEIQSLGADYPDTRQCALEYSELLLRRQRWAEAAAVLHQLLAAHSGQDNWQVSFARWQLGAALCGEGAFADAAPNLLQGYTALHSQESAVPAVYRPVTRKAMTRVIELYRTSGRSETAATWESQLASDLP